MKGMWFFFSSFVALRSKGTSMSVITDLFNLLKAADVAVQEFS